MTNSIKHPLQNVHLIKKDNAAKDTCNLSENFKSNKNNEISRHASADISKPCLFICNEDPTATAYELSLAIAQSGQVFNRGGPVRVYQKPSSPARIVRIEKENVVILAHEITRPIGFGRDGRLIEKPLPDRIAKLYLALENWPLQDLAGIATTPLLAADGSVRFTEGYDRASQMWLSNIPNLSIPAFPSFHDAQNALALLRFTFRTFPFADALMQLDGQISAVAMDPPPAQDETAFLNSLLTAVCRPSLPLAPGFLINAPLYSGAGTGKGLLVNAISSIAFNTSLNAFTPSNDTSEFEKRLASAFIEAQPIIFIDNANNATLKSDLLASTMTERHIRIRPLGSSKSITLRPKAFVAITGNGVDLSEDLARRFLISNLEAQIADPEARPFKAGFLDTISSKRLSLLSACMTILRWGRQNEGSIPFGLALGSYEQWARWVRDPLLALGCTDPVERIRALKTQDPERLAIEDIFVEWWRHHGSKPMKAADLDKEVTKLLDPQWQGRQYLVAKLKKLTGTRLAGFVLTTQKDSGKWVKSTYSLQTDKT